MNTRQSQTENLLPWKRYLIITIDSLLTFYLATFCLAMFFTHNGKDSIFSAIFLSLLYVFVILACAKRIIQALPLQALMIIIPIAPLLMITVVISLIPVLQKF